MSIMSWLNTANIASLAKNALKEAQKTIDKALDITESVGLEVTSTSHNNASIGKEIENFFESFGFTKEDESHETNKTVVHSGDEQYSDKTDVVITEPSSSNAMTLHNKHDLVKDPENCNTLFNSDIQNFKTKQPTNFPIESDTIAISRDVPISNDQESLFILESEIKGTRKKNWYKKVAENVIISDLKKDSDQGVLNDINLQAEGASSLVHHHEPSTTFIADAEELDVHESFHSSISTSSSITIISPELESFSAVRDDRNGCDSTDALHASFLKCDIKSGDEISTILSDAIRDSMKTENSASISGDEVETTASSDIEIIASPQSGYRKNLPLALTTGSNVMAHHRKPSEASSDDSLNSALEIERMEPKVSELYHLLQASEAKILEWQRKCSTLTNELEEIKLRVSQDGKERLAAGEALRRQTEDFAQRISSVEKRYQQVLAERNSLMTQLEAAKRHQGLSEQLKEKEDVIQELRTEGEKLSKQHLQHSNLIKKLRAKEKEDEQQLKLLKDKNEEMAREVEKLKKGLAIKEDIERNQIESVRQLTIANSAMDKELEANKCVTRNLTTEIESLRRALSEVKDELAQVRSETAARDSAETERNLSAEVSLRQQLQLEFETSRQLFEEEKQALTLRSQELIHTLSVVDSEYSREKEQMRNEISRLMQRLNDAEAQHDELSQALMTATRPLLRQIETLQLALSLQKKAEEKSENILEQKLNEVQRQLRAISEKEEASRNAYSSVLIQVDQLSERLQMVTEENKKLSDKSLKEEMVCQKMEQDFASLQIVKCELEDRIHTLNRKLQTLECNFDLQTTALEEERNKSALLLERLQSNKENHHTCKVIQPHANPQDIIDGGSEKIILGSAPGTTCSRSSSPTLSLSKLSLSGSLTESHSSNPWISNDEVFEDSLATPVPRATLYDGMRMGNYSAIFENLQSQLKTREGEVAQFQQELQIQSSQRDSLAQELAQVINSNQDLNRRIAQLDDVLRDFGELKTNYNALLQMYGEKIEENEELRLDLADVKEMYKNQIDQLTKL